MTRLQRAGTAVANGATAVAKAAVHDHTAAVATGVDLGSAAVAFSVFALMSLPMVRNSGVGQYVGLNKLTTELANKLVYNCFKAMVASRLLLTAKSLYEAHKQSSTAPAAEKTAVRAGVAAQLGFDGAVGYALVGLMAVQGANLFNLSLLQSNVFMGLMAGGALSATVSASAAAHSKQGYEKATHVVTAIGAALATAYLAGSLFNTDASSRLVNEEPGWAGTALASVGGAGAAAFGAAAVMAALPTLLKGVAAGLGAIGSGLQAAHAAATRKGPAGVDDSALLAGGRSPVVTRTGAGGDVDTELGQGGVDAAAEREAAGTPTSPSMGRT